MAEQSATVAGRGTDDFVGWRHPVAHFKAKLRRSSSVANNMSTAPGVSRLRTRRSLKERLRAVKWRATPACMSVLYIEGHGYALPNAREAPGAGRLSTTTESRIQIDKLDNQTWGIWSRKFKALLLSKRLGGVIDGTDEDKDNSSQVLGLIQLHLSDAYLSMADDVATAKALWDKLEATFTAQNNARRLMLRQELNSLKKAPTESIAEFVARAKELATNLEAVGHKPEDSEVSLSV
ncbi:hypothetical protein WJX82_005334 [Trebouxia sp. C0006]